MVTCYVPSKSGPGFDPVEPIEKKEIVFGVAPDAPIVTNENGGKQSDTPYDFTLIPVASILKAAEVAKYGADKYGESFGNRNYTKIPAIDHVNHAIVHLYSWLAGDTTDDHLGHAITRILFAYDCAKREGTLDGPEASS